MWLILGLCFLAARASAQTLVPGFDKLEYIRLMHISAQFGSKRYAAALPVTDARLLYSSPVTGFDNCWQLWRDTSGIIIINLRGTTREPISWLANLYAAMVPAKGRIMITDHDTFHYELAQDPRAAVHAGWLAATAFMAKDILQKTDSCYRQGHRNFLIIGHSQGGAIAYLLTAYMRQLQQNGKLPSDIRLKTYCSAAPKPGNLYFAYEYEAMTQNGWAYNVVNSLDWVPQTPFSLQTVSDFPEINPFKNARRLIKKQKWPRRWALHYAYGRLTQPSRKALKHYQKFLGDYAGKMARKNLPGLSVPAYAPTNDYVRTGNTVVLLADDTYKIKFPQDEKNIFCNHFHQQYVYLAAQLPE